MKLNIDPILLSTVQSIIIRRKVPLKELMEELNCSQAQVRYKLNKMNEFLSDNDMPEFVVQKGEVISNVQFADIAEVLPDNGGYNFKHVMNQISSSERGNLECVLVFCAKEPVSVAHFQIGFQISRNSVLNDLKNMKGICAEHHVKLEYSRLEGYYFEGNGKDIRAMIFHCLYYIRLNHFFISTLSQILGDARFADIYYETRALLQGIVEEHNIYPQEEYLEQVVCMLTFLQYHCQSPGYVPVYEKNINLFMQKKTRYHDLSREVADGLPLSLPEEELDYICTLLLCLTCDTDMIAEVIKDKQEILRQLSEELITRFALITHSNVNREESPQEELLKHFQCAYFRMKYGFYVVNLFLHQITVHYGEIYSIAKAIISNTSSDLGIAFNDDEMGYIMMYLITLLDMQGIQDIPNQYDALLYCHSGKSIGMVLLRQLETLFRDITFKCCFSKYEFMSEDIELYDVIFSTKPVREQFGIPCFTITQIYLRENKENLKNEVYKAISEKNELGQNETEDNLDMLMKLIQQYCDVKDSKGLKEALSSVGFAEKKHIRTKPVAPSFRECLTLDKIQVKDRADSWEEAIFTAAAPLIASGNITENYAKLCIDTVKEQGPYMILYNGIIVPHAYAKDDVFRTSFSFLKLKEPVKIFGEPRYTVQIIIIMGAVDNKVHLKALGELLNLLTSARRREQLHNADSPEEIERIFFGEQGGLS